MKCIFKYISFVFIVLSALIGWSCVNEAGPCVTETPGTDDNGDDKFVMLRIGTLSIEDTKEMVKSLRIIVTNDEGSTNPENAIIEFNEYIELKKPSSASTFDYTWVKPTNYEGTKDIYVIANEESVEGLTEELDQFAVETSSEDFLSWMKNYAFIPNYEEQDGNFFLTYTSVNEDITTDTDFNIFVTDIYLIPVATKFIFNFYNYREYPVSIKEISITPVNTSNYLFAQVGESDKYKFFDDKKLFWVDWLKKVAEESLKYEDFTQNEIFNNLYGWISDYNLPPSSSKEQYIFFSEENKFPVPGYTVKEGNTPEESENIPGTYRAGPYYLPESKNEETYTEETEDGKTNTITRQSYYLTMYYTDSLDGDMVPEFEDIPISNLRALFRDTYVIINIRMYAGDVDIFAEIAPWNQKEIKGWVEEGNAPGNNPFK